MDFPSLEALILDPGCKFLFQLARSDNTAVLCSSLRAISIVFDSMRKHLKLQQELFLAFTIDRLAPPFSNRSRGQPNVTVATSGKKDASYPGTLRPGTPTTPKPNSEKTDREIEPEKGTTGPSRVLVAPARGETRNLILETLTQISGHPSFMVDLYVNYDCDINCENIFERLIDFLTKVLAINSYSNP